MKNRKFFISLIATFTSLFILVNFMVALRLPIYKIKDEGKFINIPNNILISNVGGSHGLRGIDWSVIDDDRCFNFTLSAQTLSYSLRVVECFKENFSSGGVLVINVGFGYLSYDEKPQINFPSKNKRYYSFLAPEYIKDYKLLDAIKYKFPVFYYSYDIINLIRQLIFTEPELASEVGKRKIDLSKVDLQAKMAIEEHIIQYNKQFNQREIEALYGIINFCKENNITPVIITFPHLDEYLELIPIDFKKEFYKKIEYISNEISVNYYDYSNDQRFRRYDLYLNSDHLNNYGAEVFTKIIIEEIPEIKKTLDVLD